MNFVWSVKSGQRLRNHQKPMKESSDFGSTSDKITSYQLGAGQRHIQWPKLIRRVLRMELKDFIQIGLDRSRQATLKAIDGLTYDEIRWRPGPGANSIGIILLHQARSEDMFVQSRVRAKPQLWESEKWYERMNLSPDDTGAHLTVEQVNSFPVPDPKLIVAYGDAVRARTVQFLKDMATSDFDKIINTPRLGDVSVGFVFSLILVHLSEHAGDISYLRGLQRGLDK
jgi:hypothetical protein